MLAYDTDWAYHWILGGRHVDPNADLIVATEGHDERELG